MKTVVAQWGVSKERVTRVYSALKCISVLETKEALRATLGYKDFVVVTAARLVPWKGVRMLIDVVFALRKRGIPVTLEVIGDGVCRAEFEEHTHAIGALSYVHFVGSIDRDELGTRIKAADAFVLNTSYEGLSHQLIEVMSIGTPIITTAVGGNPELITHGETGLLTAYNDAPAITAALENVMSDRTRAFERSEAASARVTLFHEDLVIKEFVACIQKL
jgi:glycosyltransferase involved in cell wall biosynthesis